MRGSHTGTIHTGTYSLYNTCKFACVWSVFSQTRYLNKIYGKVKESIYLICYPCFANVSSFTKPSRVTLIENINFVSKRTYIEGWMYLRFKPRASISRTVHFMSLRRSSQPLIMSHHGTLTHTYPANSWGRLGGNLQSPGWQLTFCWHLLMSVLMKEVICKHRKWYIWIKYDLGQKYYAPPSLTRPGLEHMTSRYISCHWDDHTWHWMTFLRPDVVKHNKHKHNSFLTVIDWVCVY